MSNKKAMKDREKAEIKKMAALCINELFDQAGQVFKKDPDKADECVALARKVGMKTKVRMPSEFKRRFCKHCNKYLVPSINCRVLTRNGMIIYYCLNCKKYNKFVFKTTKSRKQKMERKKKQGSSINTSRKR